MPRLFTDPAALAKCIANNFGDSFTVGVDGFYDAGKSSLSRKSLCPILCAAHICLDDYVLREAPGYAEAIDCEQLKRRLAENPRNVIEGAFLFDVAETCELPLDATVYVKRLGPNDVWQDEAECDPPGDHDEQQDQSPRGIVLIRRYHVAYRPHEKADYVFHRRG